MKLVEAKRWHRDRSAPGYKVWYDEWAQYPTRTLEDLNISTVQPNLDGYGGYRGLRGNKTGFFHTERIDGRWWIVDPDGNVFISIGVCGVRYVSGARNSHNPTYLKRIKQYPNPRDWAYDAMKLLKDHGFNTLGCWSDFELFDEFPFTVFIGFSKQYRNGNVLKFFDPTFREYAFQIAQQICSKYKDNPYLLGYFSDNELPFRRSCMENYMSLPAGDPTKRAFIEVLRAQYGGDIKSFRRAWDVEVSSFDDLDTMNSLSPGPKCDKERVEQDRAAWIQALSHEYYKVVSEAIKSADPNHMYLGSRINNLGTPEHLTECGKFADIVSINCYGRWVWDQETLNRLAEWAQGKPLMVTEFYVKGEDSGLPNRTGAGWLVRTQRDRGLFYQNFTISLLENPNVVGWHWYRYEDNDPRNLTEDPSNRDSNKGIVNIQLEPYQDLLNLMRQLNFAAYEIALRAAKSLST